jgi:quinol monooxygenase YgiN
MIRIVAGYTVKSGKEQAAQDAVRKFVRSVRSNEPSTDYLAFRLADTPEFLHVMTFADETGHQKHRQSAHTLTLVEELYPQCDGEPTFTLLVAIE